ncbi:MAG TPA: MATE family efflux transporter, partial [Ruminococcaceae bacterium]|nr:MATE family efflux transporter [Oscillospiraceae bacterium]
MKIRISEHFTFSKLIKFTVPSIVMMIFTSVYSVVDGFFVSNFTGKTQFAAVNLVMPFLMLLGVFGFMLGTGGNAIVSKTQGEGRDEKANQIFSMLVVIAIIIGLIFSISGAIAMPWIVKMLGATEDMFDYCVLYGRIICISVMPFTLQLMFQSFLPTAGKPQIGLIITVIAGVTNIILDFLFVGIFKWGIVGAAAATVTGECIGGLFPLFYFLGKNSSSLHLCKFNFDFKIFLKTCVNGSSELMTNVSTSLVNMLYNMQLM